MSTDSSGLGFRQLSTGEIIARTTVGALLFLSWLLLFIFGMSLKADDYRACIFWNERIDLKYLLLYASTFTPTNVAMLASLAGVLGGFASNLAANNQFRYRQLDTIDPKSDEFTSYLYMTESPLVSMLRGFITYLIFITGSYLTNFTDPTDTTGFVGLTASSYFKFAVSVSLLAYLAGYDPSRMKSLINSINIGNKNQPGPIDARQTTSIESVTTPNGAKVDAVIVDKRVKRVLS